VGRVGNTERAGRVWGGITNCLPAGSFLVFSFVLLYGGTPAPESCAQRNVEGDGSLLLQLTGRGPAAGLFPLLAFFGHISLGDDGFDLLRELNK